MEMEATGAPQKHHHTLNQQVGSITVSTIRYVDGIPWRKLKRRNTNDIYKFGAATAINGESVF